MALFQLREVKKHYGKKRVLDIPHLEFEEKKIYAVLGPNGAGKTTLLRLMNGLEIPDAGTVIFLGLEIKRNSREVLEALRQMSMVFQKPVMFKMSVFDNVAYGLRVRKLGGKEIKKRVSQALELVGMESMAMRNAATLSGGEMQRVALARAFAVRPRVLLLDEPTANLDPSSVGLIEGIIKNSKSQFDLSIIMVTHNLFQAKRVADETMLLCDGEVVELCETEKFFTCPAQEKTRRFLDGTMVY